MYRAVAAVPDDASACLEIGEVLLRPGDVGRGRADHLVDDRGLRRREADLARHPHQHGDGGLLTQNRMVAADGRTVDRPWQLAGAAGDHQPGARVGHRLFVGTHAGVAAEVATFESEPEGACGPRDGRRLLDAQCRLDESDHGPARCQPLVSVADLLRPFRRRHHDAQQARTSGECVEVVRLEPGGRIVDAHPGVAARGEPVHDIRPPLGLPTRIDGVLDVQHHGIRGRGFRLVELVDVRGGHEQPGARQFGGDPGEPWRGE